MKIINAHTFDNLEKKDQCLKDTLFVGLEAEKILSHSRRPALSQYQNQAKTLQKSYYKPIFFMNISANMLNKMSKSNLTI